MRGVSNERRERVVTGMHLPVVDQPEVTMQAPADRVWSAVERVIPGPNPSRVLVAFRRLLVTARAISPS
jgi:hypothetical protein